MRQGLLFDVFFISSAILKSGKSLGKTCARIEK